jgi:DNA-binding response OmpR family regulator
MKKRILIVEDNESLAEVLKDNLTFEGFDVRCVTDGTLVVEKSREFPPDLVLLDIMLPGKDGFEICQTLRQHRSVAILMLTAKAQKPDRLRGLTLGADDYITKPFDLEELIARIHAVLRRTHPDLQRLTLGRVTIDFQALQASDGDRQIDLSHLEFELLQYLAVRPGAVIHRDDLLRDVWGYPSMPNTRSVDQAIARLRRKIEADPHHPRYIHTVHGEGYSLTPEGDDPTKARA